MTNATDIATTPAPQTIKRSVMIYSRYERFWHWTQALLVLVLIFTGFAVHGTHHLIRFSTAVEVHTIAGVGLTILWIFTIFWQFTTGEWRHYAPKAGLFEMIKFYGYGILTGHQHPFHKSLKAKQNALQTMAYLGLALFIGPLLWASGILYLTYPWWKASLGWLGLGPVAAVHTAGAFLMVVFLIGHVYIVTTGRTVGEYFKQMVTGYDEIELDPVEEKYLETHHGGLRKR
jgi:thiosulfate reductase cytochrome b subunit